MGQSEAHMWRIGYDIVLFSILVGAAWYDKQHKQIPDVCCIWLAVIGLFKGAVCSEGTEDIFWMLSGAAAGSVPMFLMTLVVPGAFGGGDIKLMAAAGLELGAKGILTAFVIAATAAGCYGAVGILLHCLNSKDRIAFGPFLSLGIGIVHLIF